MKQLVRLLFLQGHRCFFCEQTIAEGDASVEHLVASSNGGGNGDDNCVACCKTVNAAFGNLSVKAKLQAILNQRGGFSCPRESMQSPEQALPAGKPSEDRVSVVVADLQKRGQSRPRKVTTLHNTIAAVFQKSLTDAEVSALFATLVERRYVVVDESKVAYSLPPQDD